MNELKIQTKNMLKNQDPTDFKDLITALVLKCIKLNMEPMPDPDSLTGLVDELYDLMQQTWPGVRPEQLWQTFKNGMAKGGAYRLKINYPTLANWILYQRVNKLESMIDSEVRKSAPPIEAQASDLMKGLAEYRERVKRGEYKPKGR